MIAKKSLLSWPGKKLGLFLYNKFGSGDDQKRLAQQYRKDLADLYLKHGISKEYMPLGDIYGAGDYADVSMHQQAVSGLLKQLDHMSRMSPKLLNQIKYDPKKFAERKAALLRKLQDLRYTTAVLKTRYAQELRKGNVGQTNPFDKHIQKDNKLMSTAANWYGPLLAVNRGLRDSFLTGWMVRGINSLGGMPVWNDLYDKLMQLTYLQDVNSELSSTLSAFGRVAGMAAGSVADSMIGGSALNGIKALKAAQAAKVAVNAAQGINNVSRAAQIGSKALSGLLATARAANVVLNPGGVAAGAIKPLQAAGWKALAGRTLVGGAANAGLDTLVVNPALSTLVDNGTISANTALGIVQGINFARGMTANKFVDPKGVDAADDAIKASARYNAAANSNYKLNGLSKPDSDLMFAMGAQDDFSSMVQNGINPAEAFRRLSDSAPARATMNNIFRTNVARPSGLLKPLRTPQPVHSLDQNAAENIKNVRSILGGKGLNRGLYRYPGIGNIGHGFLFAPMRNIMHDVASVLSRLLLTPAQRKNLQLQVALAKSPLYAKWDQNRKAEYNRMFAYEHLAYKIQSRLTELLHKYRTDLLTPELLRLYSRLSSQMQLLAPQIREQQLRVVSYNKPPAAIAKAILKGQQASAAALSRYNTALMMDPMYARAAANNKYLLDSITKRRKALPYWLRALVGAPYSALLVAKLSLPWYVSQLPLFGMVSSRLYDNIANNGDPGALTRWMANVQTNPEGFIQHAAALTSNDINTNYKLPFTGGKRLQEAIRFSSPLLTDMTLATSIGRLEALSRLIPEIQASFDRRMAGMPGLPISDYLRSVVNKVYDSLHPAEQQQLVQSIVGNMPQISSINDLINARSLYSNLARSTGQSSGKLLQDILKYITDYVNASISNMPGIQGQLIRLLVSSGLINVPGYSEQVSST